MIGFADMLLRQLIEDERIETEAKASTKEYLKLKERQKEINQMQEMTKDEAVAKMKVASINRP